MKVKSSIETLVPYRSKQLDVPIVLNANETRNYLFPGGFPIEIAFEKYPNTNADELRDELAKRYDLKRENFIIGNGSTELLELAVKTFTEPGDYILTFDPSFAMYDIYSQIHGTFLLKVPAEADGRQSVDKMIALAQTYQPSLIFICTPNNPTGAMNSRDEILRLVESTDALVVVDEAYIDFAKEENSVMSLVEEYDNLMVARTFSKAYGLAALRLGYVVANPFLVNTLLKVKLPYSVNSVSIAIGLEALTKQETVKTFLNDVVQERNNLYDYLIDLGMDVYPSQANFLFVKSTVNLQETLLQKGILIRSFGNDAYRITIGTTKQNSRLKEALKEVLS